MTKVDIEGRVARIRECAKDYESAHAMEDKLYEDLLLAIVSGDCWEPAICAKAALETKSIKFPRYCA